VYRHEPGRTITEYDDTLFCMLTMNHHQLHINEDYAEQTQFRQRVVVGTLVFSLAVGMAVRDTSGKAIAALEYTDVRHYVNTFHCDSIYSESEVLEKRISESQPERGIVALEVRVYNQRREKALSFKRRLLVPLSPIAAMCSGAEDGHRREGG
jgi:acyl dehydratase